MAIHRVSPGSVPGPAWPLHGVEATRAIEAAALSGLPSHALMQRAGLSVARLALALAPHARTLWLACGPGNNGGDGLEAAMHLRQWGKHAVVTWLGEESRAPADALASLARARGAGVVFAGGPPEGMTERDLCVDALLGIGNARAPEGPDTPLARCLAALDAGSAPVLAVDLPSGLNADTGRFGPGFAINSIAAQAIPERLTGDFHARHTLSLLTLKPGLFTAQGRDAAGQVWCDDLGVATGAGAPTAWLAGAPPHTPRAHDSHKGSYGDVAVIGGAAGMAGAALLAAQAALHAGAGRVYAALLDDAALPVDTSQPELMLRPWMALELAALTVVCGCGGGDAVRGALPAVLSGAARLVLDADALNAIATDASLLALLRARAARRPSTTLLTPHPLEAARLLGCDTAVVQSDRLVSAQRLADATGAAVVLKGSGSIAAAPGRTPVVNPTGNARLASAGTGDVLAGLAGALLARGAAAFDAGGHAAWLHGQAADDWPAGQALTAGALARRLKL